MKRTAFIASALCLTLAAFSSFAGYRIPHDSMGKPETHDKMEKMGKSDKMGKKDKMDKQDKMEKTQKMDKMEKPDAQQ